MNEICAVVVTYNRAELLCRNIEHLLKQTCPLDILIYDNHSTQDTKGILRDRGLLRDNVRYYYAESNTGGSGGFHYGMKMAVDAGYKYLWVMDDDGYPLKADTLSLLNEDITKMKTGEFAINSLVVCDEKGEKLSFLINRSSDAKLAKDSANNRLIDGIMPYNGTLFSAELVRKIGYPIKEFFVYGDENEYYLRARKAGAELYTDVESLYFHPTNLTGTKKFLGWTFYISNAPLWKDFCAARNKMYIAKKYEGMPGVCKHVLKGLLSIAAIEGNRTERLKVFLTGCRDGYREDFSRELDFSK